MSVLLDNFDPDCSKNLIAWLIGENFYHDAMSDVSIRFNVLLSTNDQICFKTHLKLESVIFEVSIKLQYSVQTNCFDSFRKSRTRSFPTSFIGK